ncbi:MAG TPA: hypothetical protein VN598_03685 [Usitatibacter sp.]|nr:hypothetical protein [Usitatibacter sp.]
MTRLAWFLSSMLAIAAGGAFAQSPFAGTWSGAESGNESLTCSCSGSCGGVGTITSSCTYSTPWTATVDAQGNLVITTGTGSGNCNDGSTFSIPPSAPIASGQVPANGTLTVPSVTDSETDPGGSFSISCSAYSIQFAAGKVTGNGSCNFSSTFTFTDPTNGFTQTCHGPSTFSLSGSQGGSGATTPIFPISVVSNITATTASATAQVSPPAAQVGTMGSVFVFAHTRQSKLTPASMDQKGMMMSPRPIRQADGGGPDPCVLAQLGPGGQLTAASASNLTAYATGILSSQGQSVTILDNVPTPNVSGASFFVGYGSSSSSMISSGTYEGAVSVTGTSACSAALLTGAAPLSPAALSGLWWNSNESGWGISFTQRRNVVFGAWYTYDSAGKPKWYVAPNCAMPSGVTGTNGTCTGALFQVTGPKFFGTAFNPALDTVAQVGTLTVAFTNAGSATMTYSVNGQSRTVPIVRQPLANGSTTPAVDYTDLWWNPSESGWGMVITQQFGEIFVAWYVYDNNGNPVWYVVPNCSVVGSSCSGDAYSTTGPPLGPGFDPHAVVATKAGSLTVTFSDANNATVNYTVNGATGSKSITRQTF